jgi:hypothetical protein
VALPQQLLQQVQVQVQHHVPPSPGKCCCCHIPICCCQHLVYSLELSMPCGLEGLKQD